MRYLKKITGKSFDYIFFKIFALYLDYLVLIAAINQL